MKKLLLSCLAATSVVSLSAADVTPVEFPFFTDFSQEGIAEQFTIIDANPVGNATLPFTWVIGTESVDVNDESSVYEMLRLDREKPEWRDGVNDVYVAAAVFNGTRPSTKERSGVKGDDYLITPAFMGHKNAKYTVTFGAGAEFLLGTINKGCNMEVYACPEPTVEGVNKGIKLGSVTDMQWHDASADPETYMRAYTYTPTEDGVFYICFRSVADVDKRFWITSINVDTEFSVSAPAEVENLEISAAEKGEHKVSISFTSPSKNYLDEELQELTSIDILRDDEEEAVKVFENPAKNTTLSFDDTFEGVENPAGSHTYTIVCRNSAGSSIGVSKVVWVGEDYSAPIRNLQISETNTAFKLTWDKPDAAINGGYVDFDNVNYQVMLATDEGYGISDYETLGTTKKLEYSVDKEHYASGQYLMTFKIVSITESGYDKEKSFVTIETIGGDSYELPFDESFADGECISFPWLVDDVLEDGQESQDAWSVVKEDIDTYKILSQDADGGHMIFTNTAYPQYTSRLLTPRFVLGDADDIKLSFYTGCVDVAKDDNNAIQIELCANGVYTPVGNIIKYSGSGWEKHTMDIKNESGQRDCHLVFKVSACQNVTLLLDNITLTGNAEVESLTNDVDAVKVMSADGSIMIIGSCDYAVYSLSGVCLAAGRSENGVTLPVSEGMYIVKAGEEAFKCVVK